VRADSDVPAAAPVGQPVLAGEPVRRPVQVGRDPDDVVDAQR
jgi:hypothetical protein